MKFYIETIGCQQNDYDASRLAIFLKSVGFVETTVENAKVIFILACSVRQTAVDRIFGRIRNWSLIKHNKTKRSLKIVVTSCLTPEDQRKIKEKGAYYWKFSDIKSLEKILRTRFSNSAIQQFSNLKYVPIMSGCNNFCSYCIVPYLRGREKSRSAKEIVAEVKNLIKSGKKEIILLGQNVNSFEITQNSKVKSQNLNSKIKTDFTILLEKLNNLPGKFKIGFLTNHPKDMTPDIIEAVATLSKIKKEIHLPLQSGSDRILKAMNRPYTARQYLKIVENLKFKIQNLKLSTDIIVGFPGETEKNFQETVKICKKVKFNLAYINKYSPRKGTAAYKLGDPILWREKQRRWRILNDLINK